MRRLVVMLLLGLLCGCGGPMQACTAIGALHGVAVRVAEAAAPVRDLTVRVCSSARCWTRAVPLQRDDQGELVGAADVASLPRGRLTVSGHYRHAGHVVQIARQMLRATPNYPNGRTCGAVGNSATLTIAAS